MAEETIVVPIRELTDEEALAFLRSLPDGGANLRPIDLAQRFGWPKYRVTRRLQRWTDDGLVAPRCATAVATIATPGRVAASKLQPLQRPVQPLQLRATQEEFHCNSVPAVEVVAVPVAMGVATVAASVATRRSGLDVLAIGAGLTLAGTAAWFSVRGFAVLFPGAPVGAATLALALEGSKLTTAAYLARYWREVPWIWRSVLIVLIAGLVVINMSGMFANLVAAHVGDRDRAQGLVGVQQNSIDAKIEQQRHVVADLDRRIGQIDSAIEAASTRGRTVTALNAIQDQRRARQAIVDERKKEAGTLTALQAEHASVVARGRQIEGENAPIKFIAQTLDTDTEHAVRLLIALVVLCTDLLSLSIAAAVSARR